MAKRIFKSKKKLSTVRALYRKWSEWEVGDVLVGKYAGSQIDSYDKPNWLIEVEDAFFTDKKAQKKLIGNTVGLNSNGMVDKAMKKVEEGDMVQFTYNGMEEMDGGPFKGKDKHLVEVDIVVEEGEDEDYDEEAEDDEDEDL